MFWVPLLRHGVARACTQLVRKLRQSVATLQVCGDWSEGQDATLEMATERVWVQGRASQKRLIALQACPFRTPTHCPVRLIALQVCPFRTQTHCPVRLIALQACPHLACKRILPCLPLMLQVCPLLHASASSSLHG
jgi:hypothetical protein